MNKQLFYEDVSINTAIPSLEMVWDEIALVRWAHVNADYSPYHWNTESAKDYGFMIVNGRAKLASLSQMLTNWIGPRGLLKKLAVQYRGADPTGSDALTCEGQVTNKFIKNGVYVVECEVWMANAKGERTTRGNAQVVLPSAE